MLRSKKLTPTRKNKNETLRAGGDRGVFTPNTQRLGAHNTCAVALCLTRIPTEVMRYLSASPGLTRLLLGGLPLRLSLAKYARLGFREEDEKRRKIVNNERYFSHVNKTKKKGGSARSRLRRFHDLAGVCFSANQRLHLSEASDAHACATSVSLLL